MQKQLFIFLFILLIYSCSDNSRSFTGVFKNINKSAFAREMSIIHIRENKYRISFMDGILIEEGIRRGNRIIASFKDENTILTNGKRLDSTKTFYDFTSDYNRITASSDDMNHIETYIRIK